VVNRELKRRHTYEFRCDERLKAKDEGCHVSHTLGSSGTGTPKNRDEVNRREACECDG
jgi:hypothetical protein